MTPGRFDYKTRGLMILSRCVRSARLLRVIELVSGVLLCRTSSALVLEMETPRLGVKSAVQEEANVSTDKPPQLVSGWRVRFSTGLPTAGIILSSVPTADYFRATNSEPHGTRARHLLANQTCDSIRAAAGRKGNHQRHGLRA